MLTYKRRSLLALSIALVVVLSGCFGIPRSGPDVDDPPVDDEPQMAGTVLSPANQPVAGATVAFQGRTATTDADGKFVFDEVAEGEHDLRVYVQGILLYQDVVTVSETPFVLDVQLYPNLVPNPTFAGAESQIPPQGWSLYQNMDPGHTIEVIHPDDPEKRALVLNDVSTDHEFGLRLSIPAEEGRRYRAVIRVGAVEGEEQNNNVAFQLRFNPADDRNQIDVKPEDTEGFEDWWVEKVAPEGTNQILLYVYGRKSLTPTVRIHSVAVWDMGVAEE